MANVRSLINSYEHQLTLVFQAQNGRMPSPVRRMMAQDGPRTADPGHWRFASRAAVSTAVPWLPGPPQEAYGLALLLQRQGAPPPGMLPANPLPPPAAHVPEPNELGAPPQEEQPQQDIADHAPVAAAADQPDAPAAVDRAPEGPPPPPLAADHVLLDEPEGVPADSRMDDARARFAAAPGIFLLSALETYVPVTAPVVGPAMTFLGAAAASVSFVRSLLAPAR